MKNGFAGTIGNLIPLLDENGEPKFSSFLWYRVPLFDYTSADEDLVFNFNGVQYTMDRHFDTDGGSIPPVLRIIPFAHLNPFNFPRAYFFHDCAYQYGGLYIKYENDEKPLFRLMTRKQVDILLKELLPYDGATWYDRFIINTGIYLGSWAVWNTVRKPALQKEQRKLNKIDVYSEEGELIESNK